MAKSAKLEKNPGMIMVISYAAMAVANGAVLYLAYAFFPSYIVLGNMSLTAMWALCLSIGKLTLVGTFAIPFFNQWEESRGKLLTSQDWMVGYFLINFVTLYLITRYSQVFGFGVTSWAVLALLALVMDMVQGMVMMKLENWRKNQ